MVNSGQSRMIYDFLCIGERMVLVQKNVCEKSSNKIGLRCIATRYMRC